MFTAVSQLSPRPCNPSRRSKRTVRNRGCTFRSEPTTMNECLGLSNPLKQSRRPGQTDFHILSPGRLKASQCLGCLFDRVFEVEGQESVGGWIAE